MRAGVGIVTGGAWSALVCVIITGCFYEYPPPLYTGKRITPKGERPALWQVVCRDAVANCAVAARRACRGPWEIVEGADHSRSRESSTTVPTPWEGVSRTKTTVTQDGRWEWIVKCGQGEARRERAGAPNH